jgi:hypothetical protein
MADNTDEEHLDIPTNTQSENPPDEITPAAETETINPNQETGNMEVHKHPHHVTHKKKCGEYLLEFLMLFLAVFLGFLAEYQLEHKIERDREKEYIQSMMEDLQNDTTKLSNVDISLLVINNSIDTILMYYDEMPKGANPILFRNIKAIYSYPIFIYSDRTIQQLKSSGGMRLIKNKKVANGIMDYDAFVRNYENNGAYVQRYWENLTFQRLNIIDQQALDNDLKTMGTVDVKKNYLLVSDPALLHRLKSFVYELRTYHSNTLRANIKLREKAIGLIEILKKEYHLE